MDISEFHTAVDILFAKIAEYLDQYVDEHDADIDYETHGNLLSIAFANHSKIIINTQEPLLQVWMATRQQGYHFDNVAGQWICNRSGATFTEIFQQAIAEQAH